MNGQAINFPFDLEEMLTKQTSVDHMIILKVEIQTNFQDNT